jgi:lipopolysaccharide transport system permease protein
MISPNIMTNLDATITVAERNGTPPEPAAVRSEPASVPTSDLPDRPLIVIAPTRGWVSLKLRDLWAYRELLYFLAWRDIKVRYKQTVFGVLWAIIQPVLTALIFTLFFGRFMHIDSDGVPYELFALAGLLPWTFFSGSVLAGSASVVGSAHLITKVYFPRLIVPLAAILAKLVDFAIAFGVLAVMMIWYEIPLTWQLLLVPPLVLAITALAVGVSAAASALNVQYRDLNHVLPFAVQLGMFVTPIIFPVSIVPERFRWLVALNPLTGLIETFRAALFGLDINWPLLGGSLGLTLGMLLAGLVVFRRMERNFADVI